MKRFYGLAVMAAIGLASPAFAALGDGAAGDATLVSGYVTTALYPAITTVLPIVVTIGLIFWVFRKVWKAKH